MFIFVLILAYEQGGSFSACYGASMGDGVFFSVSAEACAESSVNKGSSNSWEKAATQAVSNVISKGTSYSHAVEINCVSRCWIYQWYSFLYDPNSDQEAHMATYEYFTIYDQGKVPRCLPKQCLKETGCQKCTDGPIIPPGALEIKDNVPYYHGEPICSQDFNQAAATGFCKKLGFSDGTFTATKGKYEDDAVYIGSCKSQQYFPNCDKSAEANINCKKGQPVAIEIKCVSDKVSVCMDGSGGSDEGLEYIGCYANTGSNRISGQVINGRTFYECVQLADIYFGMENSQNYDTANAECVLLENMPANLQKVDDSHCIEKEQPQPVIDGTTNRPLGTNERIAIYKKLLGQCQVAKVGAQTENGVSTKKYNLSNWSYKCPAKANKYNFIQNPDDKFDVDTIQDIFNVKQAGSEITITRRDKQSNWDMDVQFRCCKNSEDAGFTLVKNKVMCVGGKVYKSALPSAQHCANACKGISSMFAYGTNDYGTTRCWRSGNCDCYCQPAASSDGTCKTRSHKGYNLFRFDAEFSSVAIKKECTGTEVWKGRLANVEECANACRYTSSMFVFGTNEFGNSRCGNYNYCNCYCETSAKADGTCSTTNHNGYNLYKFSTVNGMCWSKGTICTGSKLAEIDTDEIGCVQKCKDDSRCNCITWYNDQAKKCALQTGTSVNKGTGNIKALTMDKLNSCSDYGYTKKANWGCGGNDINYFTKTSVGDCQAYCSSDASCTNISFKSSTGECWVKTDFDRSCGASNPDVDTYFRNNVGVESSVGVQFDIKENQAIQINHFYKVLAIGCASAMLVLYMVFKNEKEVDVYQSLLQEEINEI